MRNYEYDIAILAPFPSSENIKDGMMQRIIAIDNIVSNKKRIYIDLSFKKYLFGNHSLEKIDDNLFRLRASVLNVSEISKILFNSKKIYIHSLHNLFKALPWILFTNSEIFFDLHGIVPEEAFYRKKYIKYLILDLAQRSFFTTKKKF